jgi:hypothetical protein
MSARPPRCPPQQGQAKLDHADLPSTENWRTTKTSFKEAGSIDRRLLSKARTFGAVRSISYSIDLNIFQRIGIRNDNLPIPWGDL